MLQLVSIVTQLKSTAEIDQETTYHLFFLASNVYVSRKCCSSYISLVKKQQVPRLFLADEV